MKINLDLLLLVLLFCSYKDTSEKQPSSKDLNQVVNNTNWTDIKGDTINAHEGGISCFSDVFYWYDTNYQNNPSGKYGVDAARNKATNGLNVYSSSDLVNLKCEEIALAVPDSKKGFNSSSHRQHVLFNEKTRKYVMWFFHFRAKYPDIIVKVAISDTPTGPFEIVSTEKTGSPEIKNAKAASAEPRTTGPDGCSQDLNVFQDEDCSAYMVYDDGIRNIQIDKLADDYLSSNRNGIIVFPADAERHESPAMAKYKGKYFVGASCMKGWDGSPTYYATAANPLVPYSEKKLMAPLPNPEYQEFAIDQFCLNQRSRWSDGHGRPMVDTRCERY
jgi:hypothetical protein